jgi:hypothetical protein
VSSLVGATVATEGARCFMLQSVYVTKQTVPVSTDRLLKISTTVGFCLFVCLFANRGSYSC